MPLQTHHVPSCRLLRVHSTRPLERRYYHNFKQPSAPPTFPNPIYSSRDTLPIFSLVKPFHPFTTSAVLLKKGGKENNKSNITRANEKISGETDPLDFADYEAAVSSAHENLKNEISKLKASGRDVGAIENLRVRLGKGGKAQAGGGREKGEKASDAAWAKIGDLASVVQRGRNVVVMVGEKDHLKTITSTLNSTPDLNPQTSTTPGSDPLHITIPIPPITRESRQQASKLAHEKGEAASFALREARGAQKKKLRALQVARKVGPDRLRRAEKEMEKVNERANAEIKKVVDEAKRRLEGG